MSFILLVCLFAVQERDQRRWDDAHLRCEENKPSAAVLQGHDGISGIGCTEMNRHHACEERKLSLRPVMMSQAQTSPAVNSVVLLVDKESSQRPERCPGMSVSLFTLFAYQ